MIPIIRPGGASASLELIAGQLSVGLAIEQDGGHRLVTEEDLRDWDATLEELMPAAVVNLLGNAAKYTPDGGRVTFRVDADDQKLEFSVADTGIGIDEEDLPKLFQKFYRANDQRLRDITGSGLGLALAREVIRLHGGDITVQSVLNEGSTFTLRLPVNSAVATN